MSLQSKVLNYLKKQPETWAIKVEVANERGCPDILCCCKGVFFGIEIKEGKKDKLSGPQTEQLKRIKAAGGRTIVVRNMDDIKERG